MFNWEGNPLPADGVPLFYLQCDEKHTFNDYHDLLDSTGNPLRIVLSNYAEWSDVDGVLHTVNPRNMHKKENALPYDEVLVSTLNDGVPVIFARSTATQQVFVHCVLDGDWDLVIPLRDYSDDTANA